MRRLMSARIARDVGAWLSATESPWHSGHLISVASSCARAAGDWSPFGQSTTAERDRHDDREADPRPPPPDHPYARAAARNCLQLGDVIGPYFDAATIPLGETASVSGWPRVAKSSAAWSPGSSAIGPLHPVVVHVRP